MRLKFFCLSILVVACNISFAQGKGYIKGTINLSSYWHPRLYLLQPKQIVDLLSGSDKTIIDSAVINEDGSFHISLAKLSEESAIYRLNMTYKEGSGGAIIRNGIHENFIFVWLNRNSIVQLRAAADSIDQYVIRSGYTNNLLKKIRAIRSPVLTSMRDERALFESLPHHPNKDSLMMAVLQRVQANMERNNLLLKKFIDTVRSDEAALIASYELFTNSAAGSEADYLEKKLLSIVDKKPAFQMASEFLDRITEVKYSLPVGSVAPDIKERDMSRTKELSLHGTKAKLVLLDFWASWCLPCREENRVTVKPLYESYRSKGLEVFSVSMDHDVEKWRKAVKQDGVSWVQVSDLLGAESPIYALYKIKGLPTCYVLDENMKILAKDLRGLELYNFVKVWFDQ